MSVNSKMTALANEVRELSGTTEAMSIDEMTGTLNTENNNFATNISTQDDIIAQIQVALEGKAGGSTGEDVTAETNAYTTKITQLTTAVTALETELAGKAGGGSGSVETCTVNVSGAYVNRSDSVSYTTYSNGSFNAVVIASSAFDGTLKDVVCGSMISFPGAYVEADCSEGEIIQMSPRAVFYKAPLISGVTATVTLVDD